MSKKLDSFYEDRYIYMNGYFEGKKDTEKRIIMTMYKNKATIKRNIKNTNGKAII